MASSLIITKREVSGKREIRKLRHNGFVPGVIYGDNKEPTLVSVGKKELLTECFSLSFLGHALEAKLGATTEKFLPKSIDFHPVTDMPVHIDFQRISKNSKVKVSIAVEFINEDKSPGMKKGGVINFVVHRLECFCPYDSIPEKIVLDLSGKEIGESFHLKDISLPDGVVPANSERDDVIATIVGARVSSSSDNSEEAKSEETAA